MEISFIYPDNAGTEYIDSLELVNDMIGRSNSKLIVPNIILLSIRLLLVLLWAKLTGDAFFAVTYYVTGKELNTIVTWLFLYFSLSALCLFLIFYGTRMLWPLLLFVLKKRDSEESFSLSEFAERKDEEKKARKELEYYKMCDILKYSSVTDAAAVCDGSKCRIETAYENDSDSGVFTFYLDYHESRDVEHIVVDFRRKCVIFPEEDNNEN